MDFEEDDNIDIHKQFKQVLVFDEAESKYRVQLPFKDNLTGCQLYFKSLTRKLEKDEDLLQSYQSISRYQDQGAA